MIANVQTDKRKNVLPTLIAVANEKIHVNLISSEKSFIYINVNVSALKKIHENNKWKIQGTVGEQAFVVK